MTKRKVVLVEDDSSMRSLLRTLLEIEGFDVFLAAETASETELIETIRTKQPEAILMDVHLREGNGIAVLKKLRADPELAHAQVIMTSGMDVRDECLRAGANSFLLKPYMPDELITKLKA